MKEIRLSHDQPIGGAAYSSLPVNCIKNTMLDPVTIDAFASRFDADLVPQDAEEVQALAPFVATWLCNSGGSLASIKLDMKTLAAHDPQALQEINRACNWDWDEDAAHLAALDVILAECLEALDFRIAWNKQYAVHE